jgi:ATP/maltotriose-dependent transcriptional regulator MalT
MVVYREATILEMSDLAFTNEEACAVIGQSGGEATLGLITKARGWPAVIGLAVHHSASDLDGHLPSSDLYEFFAEDLFRRAASDLQRGLILLALGGDTNPDVTRTVLGKDHEAILSAALDHGFLGQRIGRLEIHPLLRTFLLEQLDHLPPADAQDTVTLVVKVLAANGMWDECLSALQCYLISALISFILS